MSTKNSLIQPFLSRQLVFVTLSALVIFAVLVPTVQAADLVVLPTAGDYSVGQLFTVSVRVDPGPESVNAVALDLNFDPKMLAVVNVSQSGSALTEWATTPTFSNTTGVVSLAGASQNPLTSDTNIIRLTFEAKAVGQTSLKIGKASILTADGQGADVFKNSVDGALTIKSATDTAVVPTVVPDENSNVTVTNELLMATTSLTDLTIMADTFTDPEQWQATTTGIFRWNLPAGTEAVAVLVATTSATDPEAYRTVEIFEPPVSEITFDEQTLSEGVQYLSVNYKTADGWQEASSYKIMIDTTAPTDFTIQTNTTNSPTGFPQLLFTTADLPAGVDHYDLIINNQAPIRLTATEGQFGYWLRNLENGDYDVLVKAYDQAGNINSATTSVNVAANWVNPSTVIKSKSTVDFSKTELLLVLALITSLILIFYISRLQANHRRRVTSLRVEATELEEQTEKIFSALRMEIFDQINTLNKGTRLTKKEKEVIDGLNQVVQVSESLLEKEITDVSKHLKK